MRLLTAGIAALIATGATVAGPATTKPRARTKPVAPAPLPGDVEAELMGVPPERARAYRNRRFRLPTPNPASRARLSAGWVPREGLVTVGQIRSRVRYRKGYLAGIPLHVIDADLRDPEVRISAMVAKGGIGQSESFGSMLARARPSAAITGTFFGISNRLPTGDIVVDGQNLYRGFIGTALAITNGNVVSFIRTDYKEEPSWHLFDTVLRTGPRLLDAGQLVVAPQEEGFTSLNRHGARSRTGVGITGESRLLLVAAKEPVSLYRLGVLMQSLGAYHAAALDGGTSTALSFGGRIVASPGRTLTNLLLIYADRTQYERARPQLAPSRRRSPTPADATVEPEASR